jgi:uncharacterized protein (DUF2249 family)
MTEAKIVDVRTTAPAQRHPLIFSAFEALAPGESFVLVNDHDPKPLYYQLKFERMASSPGTIWNRVPTIGACASGEAPSR